MNLKKSDLAALLAVKDFIDLNYSEEMDIKRLSNLSQLHLVKLQYGFKELFKLPVYTYLKELRMKHAADLLVTTELSIKEIAAAVGYRKTKKFSPMFKASYGVTPTQYRLRYSV